MQFTKLKSQQNIKLSKIPKTNKFRLIPTPNHRNLNQNPQTPKIQETQKSRKQQNPKMPKFQEKPQDTGNIENPGKKPKKAQNSTKFHKIH